MVIELTQIELEKMLYRHEIPYHRIVRDTEGVEYDQFVVEYKHLSIDSHEIRSLMQIPFFSEVDCYSGKIALRFDVKTDL